MIKLYQNQNTKVPFTLFEKTTLSGCTYILDLYSNQNLNTELFWLTGDTTNNNARYNLFELNASEMGLEQTTYDYKVWQTTGSTLSTSALTISDVVESGLCTVIGTGTTQTITHNPKKDKYTYIK